MPKSVQPKGSIEAGHRYIFYGKMRLIKREKGVRIAADIIADNGCYFRRVVAARAQLWHNNIINIRENTYSSI